MENKDRPSLEGMSEENLLTAPHTGVVAELNALSIDHMSEGPGSIHRDDDQILLGRIINSYSSTRLIHAYCKIRFAIININILSTLALCLRGKLRVLELGCGFGMFSCYFSSLFPQMEFCGIDIDPKRIAKAKEAAMRLGLNNLEFRCDDVRGLTLVGDYDAIMIIDLLHHIDDHSKRALLETCASHLADNGRLIIKDINKRPFWKLAFTWALDVAMTRGFDMWYWDEKAFQAALKRYFERIDTLPIADWLPYPHIVYLGENSVDGISVQSPAQSNRSSLGRS